MKGLWLSDPFCAKAPAGDVSQRTCHSLIRKGGVEKEERKKKSKWQLPSFYQIHSLNTHSHKDTLSHTCVLLFIHSCYLHFRPLTMHSLNHGDLTAKPYWCSHITVTLVLTDPFLAERF